MTITTNKKVKGRYAHLIDREKFFQIWGFMITDLKLEKTELLVYAIIFAMHKHHLDYFVGSRQYLQAWTNSGKSAIDCALASLEKKNLIEKEYRQYGPVKKAIYYVNTDMLPTCEMFRYENKNRDIDKMIRENELKQKYGIY